MLQVLSIRNMKGSYSTPSHTETPWWHKTISGIVHLPISTPPCSIVAAIRGKLIIDNFPPFSLTHTLEIYIQKMHFPLFMGKTPVLLSFLQNCLEHLKNSSIQISETFNSRLLSNETVDCFGCFWGIDLNPSPSILRTNYIHTSYLVEPLACAKVLACAKLVAWSGLFNKFS